MPSETTAPHGAFDYPEEAAISHWSEPSMHLMSIPRFSGPPASTPTASSSSSGSYPRRKSWYPTERVLIWRLHDMNYKFARGYSKGVRESGLAYAMKRRTRTTERRTFTNISECPRPFKWNQCFNPPSESSTPMTSSCWDMCRATGSDKPDPRGGHRLLRHGPGRSQPRIDAVRVSG